MLCKEVFRFQCGTVAAAVHIAVKQRARQLVAGRSQFRYNYNSNSEIKSYKLGLTGLMSTKFYISGRATYTRQWLTQAVST